AATCRQSSTIAAATEPPPMRLERIGVAVVLCLALSGVHAAMYKWVDERGRVQYSDKPPVRGDTGVVQLSNRGVILKRVEPSPSDEEKMAREQAHAQRKQEEERLAEQRRQDVALLQSFTGVEESDMKRDREVQAIEAIIANLRGQERSLAERLGDDRRRLESDARRQQPPPDSVRDDVKQGEPQIGLIHAQIESRHREIDETR